MKKLITILLFSCIMGTIKAQDIQALYGYGNGKPVNFVTAEFLKSSDHGIVKYFTDFKIDRDGYSESYTELSKYWFITPSGTAFTAQYNAGIRSDKGSDIRIVPVYLFGLSQWTEINDFLISLDVMYRIDRFTKKDGTQLTFQLSRNWDRLEISGYCDIWDSGIYDDKGNSVVILCEPQVFYRVYNQISIGFEGRLSNYSLLAPYDQYIMFGVKWNLE